MHGETEHNRGERHEVHEHLHVHIDGPINVFHHDVISQHDQALLDGLLKRFANIARKLERLDSQTAPKPKDSP